MPAQAAQLRACYQLYNLKGKDTAHNFYYKPEGFPESTLRCVSELHRRLFGGARMSRGGSSDNLGSGENLGGEVN